MQKSPHLNASLMHELRMVAQLLLVAVPAFNKLKPKDSKLVCVRCIQVRREKPNAAVAMLNGNSVCQDHI